jgi:hypothetical protein
MQKILHHGCLPDRPLLVSEKKLRRCLTEEIARLGFAPVLGGELTTIFLCWL